MVYIGDEGGKQRGVDGLYVHARACSRLIVQFIASVESQGTAVSPAHLCRSFIFWTFMLSLAGLATMYDLCC